MSEPQSSALPEAEKAAVEPHKILPEQGLLPTQATNAFRGDNAGTGWRLLTYVACAFFTVYLTMWFGTSFFREPVRGPAVLWQEMYAQAALALGVLLPAFLLARVEGTKVDEYGLPRRQAFGTMFWMGGLWGFASITVLMLALRGVRAFYFGQVVLHGVRSLRFAAFWGVFFVLVGLTEEFAMRGYSQYTLAKRVGFWPAAAVLSLAFGAIHLRNPGETWLGLAGVVAIGFFFCLTLYRTGNLWFAVGFHAFWDWAQTYLYSVPDSGTVEVGHLMRPSFQGPDWLTGGSVGPEGSVLCFVVIAAVSGVFAWRYREVKYTAGGRKENAHPSGA
ncbi:MAG TPA: type II CAAX endopeptidase family protein [Terriglobales bacterium]|nr:type II CAAX endopeptidase family protein [Terriglobales bacterium]